MNNSGSLASQLANLDLCHRHANNSWTWALSRTDSRICRDRSKGFYNSLWVKKDDVCEVFKLVTPILPSTDLVLVDAADPPIISAAVKNTIWSPQLWLFQPLITLHTGYQNLIALNIHFVTSLPSSLWTFCWFILRGWFVVKLKNGDFLDTLEIKRSVPSRSWDG